MSFKKIRRVLFGVVMAATLGVAAAFSGCVIETDHPRAKITIEFNDNTYVLEYTLYRNMYPQTVRHFIELAESGFYDNTIIHDYTTNDWYGGGYSYDDDEASGYAASYDSLAMNEYLEDTTLEDDYIQLFNSGALTASVYTTYDSYVDGEMTVSREDAYYTLYGEFESNGHTVENGQRGAEFGSLKMYYTDKADDLSQQLYVKTGKGEVLTRNYEYNSATSLFAIQVNDSSSLGTSNYCTFAYLRNDDVLEELIEDIEDYIEDELDGETGDFTMAVNGVYVDNNDELSEAQGVDYTVTALPIIIRSVKITKY